LARVTFSSFIKGALWIRALRRSGRIADR